MAWNNLEHGYPIILRSTFQQTNENLLYLAPTMNGRRMTGLVLRRFEAHNRSGGAASVGIGFRIANQFWMAGTSDGTTFTDDTADAQDTGADDFTLGANADNDTYFVVLSRIPFHWMSINVGTAEVDAGGVAVPDHAVGYSNFAGTGWTALGTGSAYTDQFTLTNTVIDAGAREFVWRPPSDWGRVVSLDGLPAGFYALRVTTADAEAGDTAATGNAMEIGTMIPVEAVADNGVYANDWRVYGLAEADAVVAYFSTANAGNGVSVEVTTGG